MCRCLERFVSRVFLSTWLTSHRVGNVVSMSPESIDTLNRCDNTCVLLTRNDESSDSLPPSWTSQHLSLWTLRI